MKFGSQPVTDVFTYYAETVSLSFRDNRMPNLCDLAAGLNDLNRLIQAIKGTLSYLASFVTHLANEERLRLVSVPAVHNGGNVDIDNVTVL